MYIFQLSLHLLLFISIIRIRCGEVTKRSIIIPTSSRGYGPTPNFQTKIYSKNKRQNHTPQTNGGAGEQKLSHPTWDLNPEPQD
jgi:hypothetical protein